MLYTYYRPFLSGKQLNTAAIRGKGVCLIDFGCSVDTQVFPEETTFVGSSETDAFQCPAMVEGRPWKWQVRVFIFGGWVGGGGVLYCTVLRKKLSIPFSDFLLFVVVGGL